jgi:hypothetical protein
MTFLIQKEGEVYPVGYGFDSFIDDDGVLTGAETVALFGQEENPSEEAISGLYPLACVVWMALSLIHCKNTTVRNTHPPFKLAKKQLKEHGTPRLSYHVLDIKPMRKVLRDEGGMSSGNSAQTAMHICRGHFKDYTDKGLFGKLKGVYWWESNVRGSLDRGIALKDYRVKPEERE